MKRFFRKTVKILNNGQAQAVDYQLSHMSKVEYHRINVALDGWGRAMTALGR